MQKFHSALPAGWVFVLSFLIVNFSFAGVTVSKTLRLSSFTSVSVSGSYNVFLKQGSKQSVRAEGPEQLIEDLNTTVKDGVWKIKSKTKKKNYWKSKEAKEKVNIYITIPKLQSISVAGSGDVKAERFNVDDLKLSIAGSGDIKIPLSGGNIKASIAGAGDIDISGRASSLNASIAGSGDIDALDLQVKSSKVSIAGSGDIDVHATSDLSVSISGSGDVVYKGSPSVSKRISGSGSVRAAR